MNNENFSGSLKRILYSCRKREIWKRRNFYKGVSTKKGHKGTKLKHNISHKDTIHDCDPLPCLFSNNYFVSYIKKGAWILIPHKPENIQIEYKQKKKK